MRFDTHAHLDDPDYDNISELLREMQRQQISAAIPGVSVDATEAALELARAWDHLYIAVGIHPSEVASAERLPELERFLEDPKVVAIGEIGLDYYWVKDNKPEQQELFRRQLAMARAAKKPVIIHNREAHEDVFEMLKAEQAFEHGVIMHAYSGSPEMAREYVKLGAYISLAGPVTFKNARVPKEVAKMLPLGQLLVETDSPYLTPHPYRGKRNSPLHLQLIIDQIAELRGVEPAVIAEATTQNARRVFKL